MKKVLIILVVFVLAGCCTKTSLDGMVTKSFLNCLSMADTVVCNPTPAVINTVTMAVPIISAAVDMLVPGTTEWTTAYGAQNIANIILSGACVTTTQLNNLISFLNSDTAKIAQARAATTKLKGAGKVMVPIDVTPLIDWRDGK